MTANGQMHLLSPLQSTIRKKTDISISDGINLFQICNPRLVAQNRHSSRLINILYSILLALFLGIYDFKAH